MQDENVIHERGTHPLKNLWPLPLHRHRETQAVLVCSCKIYTVCCQCLYLITFNQMEIVLL